MASYLVVQKEEARPSPSIKCKTEQTVESDLLVRSKPSPDEPEKEHCYCCTRRAHLVCFSSFAVVDPRGSTFPFPFFAHRWTPVPRLACLKRSLFPGPLVDPNQVLAEAARRIQDDEPWYEKLGLKWEQAADAGGDVTVEAVLAFNVVSGLIDAANETVLAPAFVVLKGLLSAVQGAAAARGEIVELIQYCVGISTCLLEAAKAEDMPPSVAFTLGEFKGEMDAVGKFAQTYGTRSGGCCSKMVLNSHDLDTAAGHKQKLKDLLDTVLIGLASQTNRNVNEIIKMILDRDPPRLTPLAEIPRDAPILPPTYVQRTALVEAVVHDLKDPQRSARQTHCLLGMGGGGKTLVASSVVRDDRVRAIFKNGVFWVPVGREGKDATRLLEFLAFELARAPTETPHVCPRRFESEEEVIRHLSAVQGSNGLRCLVVLDNVWSVEVVNAFARTGFHVVVTTRQKTVISPAHSGLCTEVGNMSEEDSLKVLRKASGADGPLPAQAAREVGGFKSMQCRADPFPIVSYDFHPKYPKIRL